MKNLRLRKHVLDSDEAAAKVLAVLDFPPPRLRLAIVLDMSDSCGQIRETVLRLPGLLKRFPRNSPLSIFRLSSSIPIKSQGGSTVGDLIDENISLISYLSDREIAEAARFSGSFLGPVLGSISKEWNHDQEGQSIVLCLTDGKLHDRAKLAIPDYIKLFGIYAGDTDSVSNWRRVVGNRLFKRLSDLTLRYEAFEIEPQIPKSVSVEVVEKVGEKALLVQYIDAASKALEEMPRPKAWNSTDEPFSFLVTASKAVADDVTIILNFPGMGDTTNLALKDAEPLEGYEKYLPRWSTNENGTNAFFDLLLEVSDDSTFNVPVLSVIDDIRQLAQMRTPWKLESTSLSCLVELIEERKGDRDLDMVVCLFQQQATQSNLAIFAVSQKNSPALAWSKGTKMPLGVADSAFTAYFDRMECRWMARISGHQELELDPNASQVISYSLVFDSGTWEAVSSGPLSDLLNKTL